MKPKIARIPDVNVTARIGGRYKVRVLDAVTKAIVSETDWQKNLILNPGLRLADNDAWISEIGRCRAGTGTTPAKSTLDGTYAQTGTTVTRSTGTGTFSAGDVDKYIKFGTGEEHLIVSFTSSTEVEVRDSDTVAATTLELYDTARTTLDAEVASSTTLNGDVGANTETVTDATGNVTIKRTWDFTAEVGTVNYNEVAVAAGTGDMLSRIVLASTVTVNAGQQLQVVFELSMTCNTWLNLTAITPTITGWPWTYTNSSITSTVSDFTVTTDENHHYVAGDVVTIAGATPAGYNGTWTIASVTSNTYTVTDASNLGTASVDGTTQGTLDGDVRFKGSAGNGLFADQSGSLSGICDPEVSNKRAAIVQKANEETSLGLGGGNLSNTSVTATRSETKSAMDTNDFSWTWEAEWDIDEANFTDIKQIYFQGGPGNGEAAIVMTFDQGQRKDSGYTLKWGFKVTIRQDLP